MRRHLIFALAIGGSIACGSAASDGFSATTNAPGPAGGSDADGGTSSGGGTPAPPPEKEVESQYKAPVATGKYVWVANPTSGRVAYINASTLDVHTVLAGNGPTYLAAVPSAEDTAVVLNVLSDDATLLKASGATVTSKTFKTAHAMNAWALSPDGHWAIAWTNAALLPSAPQTEGFQDLTVIDLTGKVAPVILAVGYRPVSVGFTQTSGRAWAVTQDGVAIIDVTLAGGPAQTKNVAISDAPSEDPGTRDVSVTPDGAFALIRRDGSPVVTAVSLLVDTRTKLTLPGNVTDLDLSDKGDRAVGIVRDSGTVSIIPIPAAIGDQGLIQNVVVPGATIGSVSLSPGGGTGLLYTNAAASERLDILSMSIGAPTTRAVKLYSPVLGVFSAPDARHAVVIHQASATDPLGDLAFSLIPVADALPAKIVATKARPFAVGFAGDSKRVVVAEKDDAKQIFGVYLGRLPELMVDRYDLASSPVAVGVVDGAKRAFVAQNHPDGRITFIDLETGEARTLTGFELAARVVDGSKP
jgi:DNA-binding beta-propeller fold protein YncE